MDGVRVPDDETDLVVHRGGRFINNMYVPDPIMEKNSVAQIPDEVVITAELGPNYQLTRSGRSYQVCVYGVTFWALLVQALWNLI